MIYISSVTLLWSIFFFFFLIIFILENYINKKIKTKNFFLKNSFLCYFSWFFVSLFFILIFWFFLYKNEGVEIANSKVIVFLTSYLLEIILSIDNIFLWLFIFKSFEIPSVYQKRVLLYGIWGAIILRCIMIFLGKYLFFQWNWLLYLFGMFFIFTGFKIIFVKDEKNKKEKNIKNFWIYRIFRVVENINDEKFFLILDKKFFITPLFLSLITIELTDIIFSVDSIPAIFSITDDFFIIFTSNIFSILGLRSVYFFMARMIDKCSIMQYGLSAILIFIGFKILIHKFFFISELISFLTILIILITTFFISSFLNYKKIKL